MFKLLQDFYNNHRLSRKQMPQEEKMEFIKKSKEFSLFKVINLIRIYKKIFINFL
mgnify:CR=1 FL=1